MTARLQRIKTLRENPLVRVCAALIVAAIGIYSVRHTYRSGNSVAFYFSVIVLAAMVVFFVHHMRLDRFAAVKGVAHTFLLVAVLLPIADFFYLRTQAVTPAAVEPVKPVYSFRDAMGDPKAFQAWWTYAAGEWNGSGKFAIEAPDPKGIMRHVLIPNSRSKLFASDIRINNLGFRGADIDPQKRDHYRVFTLGESPTFGATLEPGDRPWPEHLQGLIDDKLTCARPIEVINAGTTGYSLQDNIERVRRDILPLEPDIVVSFHTFNSLPLLDKDVYDARNATPPTLKPRASPLLAAAEYQLGLLRFTQRRKQKIPAPTIEEAINSQLAQFYREMIRLGREHHFVTVLALPVFAVTPQSPSEVIDFYEGPFPTLRRTLAASQVHSQMIKELSRETDVPYVDTTPGLDGEWDADLFIDPVHFTRKGDKIFAQTILSGLKPILSGNPTLRCVDKTP